MTGSVRTASTRRGTVRLSMSVSASFPLPPRRRSAALVRGLRGRGYDSVSERSGERVEVRERLERGTAPREVAREALRREDAVSGKGGATVRVAVADIDDLAGWQERALARLAAHLAAVRVVPEHVPAPGT